MSVAQFGRATVVIDGLPFGCTMVLA